MLKMRERILCIISQRAEFYQDRISAIAEFIFQNDDLNRKNQENFSQYVCRVKGGAKLGINKKQTSKLIASKASAILRNKRYGTNAKAVAGSALAQTKPRKTK